MIKLGFSPCPNDTFIFYGIVKKKIDTFNITIESIIDDVEKLNNLALNRAIDVTKASCHAYYYLKGDYQFLRSGGAFGRGCGPILVKSNKKIEDIKRIAIPGEYTTAFLLLKLYLFFSNRSLISPIKFISMPFYKIMPSVKEGIADAGLIIHESRFTYPLYGLEKIVDLGDWWEKKTGLIIPLGGIIAKKSLGEKKIKAVESMLRSSVEYALNNRDEVMTFVKTYSQEISEEVIKKHIDLYVNEYTLDIGKEGEVALKELMRMALLIDSNRKIGGNYGRKY